MSRYLYKKIQNISPESLNFQHSGLKLTTLGSDPNVQQYPHGHNPNQLPTTGQRCTSWHTPLISIRYTSKYLQRINSSDAIPGRYFRTRSGCLGSALP